MTQLKYHLFESPLGWIGLVGNRRGLRRLSLKPTFEEVLEEMGDDLDRAVSDPSGFAEAQESLEGRFEGQTPQSSPGLLRGTELGRTGRSSNPLSVPGTTWAGLPFP